MGIIHEILRFIFRKPAVPQTDDVIKEIELKLYQGKFEKALEEINKKSTEIENDTDVGKFLKNYFNILEKRILIELGNMEEALKDMENIYSQLDEDTHPVIHQYAIIEYANALQSTGDFVKSIQLLEEIEKNMLILRLLYPLYYLRNSFRLHALKAKIYRKRAKFEKALNSVNTSLDKVEKMDYSVAKAELLNDLGIIIASTGQQKESLQYLNESLKIYKKLGNESQILKLNNNIGLIKLQLNQYEEASENLNNALAISNKLENKTYTTSILVNLGLININLGDVSQAQQNFEDALVLSKELGHKPYMSKCYINLGNIYQLIGDLDKALEYMDMSIEILQELDSQADLGQLYHNMGQVFLQKGEYQNALDLFKQSYQIHSEIGEDHHAIFTLHGIVEVTITLGKLDEAKEYLKKIEELNNKLDIKSSEQIYKLSKSMVLLESDRVVQRAEAQKMLQEIAEDEIINQHYTVQAMLRLGELLLQELQLSASEEALNEFKDLIDRLDKVTKSEGTQDLSQIPALIQVLLLRSKLAIIDLDVEEAQRLLVEAYELANSKGLTQLAEAVQKERDQYKKEMMKYKQMVENNASLYERLQQSQIENYLKRAESILKK